MRPKGLIYKRGKSKLHGEIVVTLSRVERFAFHLLRTAGAGFVGFAIIGLIFAYGPIVNEEFSYNFQDSAKRREETQLKIAEAEKIASVQKEAQYWGVNSYFSVVVPKISAASNVIANVDTSDENAYTQALQKGVAHARGTYFPGQGENIFLFSHSTNSPLYVNQYNAVFYLLRKLENGDRIIVFFADEKHEYEVYDKVVVPTSDTSYLTENTASERLVLQTCDPPGTSWKRLLVLAKPVKELQTGQ